MSNQKLYSKGVNFLKSKTKHSTESLPEAKGYKHIREAREKERQDAKMAKKKKK